MKVARRVVEDLGQTGDVSSDRIEDQERVRDDEQHEDRRQDVDRLLHAAKIQHDQQTQDHDLRRHLVMEVSDRQKREELIASGRDRDGDGQDVVDEQRASRHHADAIAEELRGDEIAAAAAGEVLDEIRVGDRDDRDRHRRHRHEDDGEVVVRTECFVRFLGSVRG